VFGNGVMFGKGMIGARTRQRQAADGQVMLAVELMHRKAVYETSSCILSEFRVVSRS